MTPPRQHPRARWLRRRNDPARAFTLVEAVICTLLVGMILVAAISTVGAARRSRQGLTDKALARVLAGDLLGEISSRAYAEPDGSGYFGADAGEQTSNRLAFDDVDDYHNLDETPPRDAAGNPIKGCEKWSRIVRVEYVSAEKPDEISLGDDGLKRITVTIRASGDVLAERSTVRARAADTGRF